MSIVSKNNNGRYKLTFKDVIKLISAVGGLLLIIFLVFQMTNNPITPATGEQVYAALGAQGYEAIDVTQRRKAERSDVVSAIEIRAEDFYFTFITFTDNKGAENVRQNFFLI